MDHAVGSVPTASQPRRTERPGWWLTIGSLLLAYFLTLAGLLLAWFALRPLKLDLSLVLGDWPWRPTDPWAIVAGAWPALLTALLFAQSLRFVARGISGWEVRPLPIALVCFGLLVLGDGLRAGGDVPRDGGSGAFWGFVLLVVVARYVAYARAPSRLRPSRRQLAAIVAVAATVATIAYRPLHPLHVQVGSTPLGSGVHYGLADDDERDPRAVEVGIDVAGPADVRILSLRAEEPGDASRRAPVVAQVLNEDLDAAPFELWAPFPAGGVTLHDGDGLGSGLDARLRLEPGSCGGGNFASVVVDALSFELETLGLRRTQRVALADPVRLSCGR